MKIENQAEGTNNMIEMVAMELLEDILQEELDSIENSPNEDIVDYVSYETAGIEGFDDAIAELSNWPMSTTDGTRAFYILGQIDAYKHMQSRLHELKERQN